MQKLLFVALSILFNLAIEAQPAKTATVKPTDTAKIYNPYSDAKSDIANAVQLAATTHKNVLLQIGGNWCIWCLRFNNLVTQDAALHKYLSDNYVTVHVNYSKENTNDSLLTSLGYPQRFGFPVFVVLDGKGARLHTQNSGYLEDGKGHSKEKVMDFLKGWSTEALDANTYKKQ